MLLPLLLSNQLPLVLLLPVLPQVASLLVDSAGSPAEDIHQGSPLAPDSLLDSPLDLPPVTTTTTAMEDLDLLVLQAVFLLASPASLRAQVPLVDSKVANPVVKERSRDTSAAFTLARFVL